MVIDDDPLFHRRLQFELRNDRAYGQVSYSLSAYDVLELLIAQRHDKTFLPDIIFLDLEMPGMDGRTFLQYFEHIRTSLAKQVRIYIVTASENFVDKWQIMAYPFVEGYYSKAKFFATGGWI